VFAPLVAIVLWMGLYPSSFIDVMAASVGNLIDNYNTALAAAGQAPDGAVLSAVAVGQ